MNNWLKNNQSLNSHNLLLGLSQRIFKQSCTLCDATIKSPASIQPTDGQQSICQDCLNELPAAPYPHCPQCGIETLGETCGHCQTTPPHYDCTHALFSYGYPVDALMQHYKYRHALYLSQTFGNLLTKLIMENDIDCIIPMPLHANRLKARGFNQSLEIAKVMAKQSNIPLDASSCLRIKNTPPQASLALKQRLKNMKGAFSCQQSYTNQHVALIDDVMTTGTSLDELAKVVKKAGASKVSCYVLARA